MKTKVLEKIQEIVIDAVFPHQCLCGEWGTYLCDECLGQIPINKKELCPICLALSENGKTCKTCRSRSHLTGVLVFGKHEKILKDAIWQYKYEFIKDFHRSLANLLISKYSSFLEQKKFLVTNVPISDKRKQWRGFNQAKEIAKDVAKIRDLEYMDLLIKNETGPQVGLKRSERIRNIHDKIILKTEMTDLANKKILIIDDVYTTGSTLEECAKVLRRAGAREVWGMVLSRD